MNGEMGVRERKKLAARKALTDAALALFEQKGFDSTTVNEIARRAGMSPRTFFRYFETKEDVVFQDAPAQLESLRALLRERPSEEPPNAALREALLSFSDVLEEQREELHLRTLLAREARSLAERAAIELQNWRLALAEELERRPGDLDAASCRLLAGVGVEILTLAIVRRADEERSLRELTASCYARLDEVVCAS